jgi:hypothetical protein
MSGLDYTKKPEIRNPLHPEPGDGPMAVVRSTQRLALYSLRIWNWIYERIYRLVFAYRTRGEKWLVISAFLMNVLGLILVMYAIGEIERPAHIEVICDTS